MDVAGNVTPQQWDDIFPGAAEKRKEQGDRAFAFGQNYLVFVGVTADPRARALLDHWTKMVRQKVMPVGASAQEYAAANALREFVEGLHAQAEFAMNGQKPAIPMNLP